MAESRWTFEAECPHGTVHQVQAAPLVLLKFPARCECDDLVEEAAGPRPIHVGRLRLWWETRKFLKQVAKSLDHPPGPGSVPR